MPVSTQQKEKKKLLVLLGERDHDVNVVHEEVHDNEEDDELYSGDSKEFAKQIWNRIHQYDKDTSYDTWENEKKSLITKPYDFEYD